MEQYPITDSTTISERALEKAYFANQCHSELIRATEDFSKVLSSISDGHHTIDEGNQLIHEANFAIQLAESYFNLAVDDVDLSSSEDSIEEPSLA